MSRRIRRISLPMLALLTVASLGFGASQALAAPQQAGCPGAADGVCSSQQACTDLCTPITGYPDSHVCVNGCCYCAY